MSEVGEPVGKPNVLFIITDQHRADHVGFMGNDIVRTPNLDSLASRGTVFENAWVANPVCMPNRSSIMTSRMPSVHGVIFNDRSLELGAATHVRQFRDAGWRTALFGKSHLQHGMSRNSVHELKATAAIDHGYPEGWDTFEDAELHEAGGLEMPDDFYGFEHVELAIDHGAKVSGHHLQWALDRGGRYEDLAVPYGTDAPALQRSDRWWQIYQPPYAEELHSTNFVTDRTISFINDAAEADEPWLAWASFPDPHHPMTPPGQWYDRHNPADMPVPGTLDDPLGHAPAYLRHMQSIEPSDMRGWVAPCGTRDPALVQEALAATYGMIEFVDDGVGRILAAIEAKGQLDNTIVVFTADHGDMMGEHGLMLKGFMPFRGTLQVPMVIVDPTREANRTSSLSSSIDLGPTLMDLCEVPTHDGLQGRSLTPLLDDGTASVRDHVLIEDDIRKTTAARAGIPSRIRTLITDAGEKYTRYSSGESMLFDLAADPAEVDELSHSGVSTAGVNERLLDAMIAATDDARGAPVRA